VKDVERTWVKNEFLRVASPVDWQIAAGRFPSIGSLVELAHAPHPVFARVLPWRTHPHPARRIVGLALHMLRLYSPCAAPRLDWLLNPCGWLDSYDFEDGRLVLAASATPEGAEKLGRELVQAAVRIMRREGRRVDAVELLVRGAPMADEERLASLPVRALTDDGPARFTLSLLEKGLEDRLLVARQPGIAVEDTSLHPETLASLELPSGTEHQLECHDPRDGIYRFRSARSRENRIIVADVRGRAPRDDGGHGIHVDSLRHSMHRALTTLGPSGEGGAGHHISIVFHDIVDAGLCELVDPIESLVPIARARGVASIELAIARRRHEGRSLVGSIANGEGGEPVQWRWIAGRSTQSDGTKLRRS